ncbi:hypothetical protein V865_007734 [Kwoniella europaea PYCC6329]|uniref:Uncharacterized protein n=1 Tax=Kwoniella europaea PYCC6329 TaxID=1423913 RepID=A0AAX4KT30_9TREE
MSDPFDDDDLFDNPETLGLLEAVEERAIQASQKPSTKPRFSQPIRHVLAKPKNLPSSSSSSGNNSRLKKEPRPINTEPGIRGGTGFGWEEGGKRSFDIDRHIGNVKKRESYWNGAGLKGEEEDDESIPIDVIMDGSGKYELINNNRNNSTGSGDEAIITDKRRAQPSMLGESLGLNGSGNGMSIQKRKQSEDAIQARRKAMAAAAASVSSEPFSNRQPMSKSNSTSTTNIITSRLSNNNNQVHPHQRTHEDQKFNANRSLSRSVSAGAQIFNRSNANAIAGPSRLPTIPCEPSSQSRNGSSENGDSREMSAPPMSQGSAARAAAIELEVERRKRQELEAELAALRTQAQAQAQAQTQASRSQRPPQQDEGQGGVDVKEKIKELQSKVWAAKGEAEMIRRAQKEEHQRHLAELEKLKLTIQDKDVQIKEKENQAKKQMENIKHQAVFSNHAAQNSAMKVRQQQSQRFIGGSQSQYRGLPTPVKLGSPSRRRSQPVEEEMTPLIKSVKGKGKAPTSGPTFGGFNNAFAATPTVGPRAKRQKTADLSPQGSPTRGPSPSPFRASPARSQRKSSPVIGEEEVDDGIDWGPVIERADEGMMIDGEAKEEEERKGEKAELLYHLLNHVSISAFQYTLGLTTEPTIYRLMNYRPPINIAGHEIYTQRCSEILKACGDPEITFEEMLEMVIDCLSDMLSFGLKVISDVDQVSLTDIAVYCNILILLTSTTFLFPLVIRTLSSTDITDNLKSVVHSIYSDAAKLAKFKECINAVPGTEGGAKKVERENWYLELADKIAGLAEAICFTSEISTWKGDELVDITLGLMANHNDSYVVKRGIEVFYVASRQSSHFRSLITASDQYQSGSPNESPLVDRLSRYLISASEPESLQTSLLIVRGLCMLSISHPDAVIIMGQKSVLVPALVIVLQRESNKLYGIFGVLQSYKDALSLLLPTLSLLHQLVFPAPIANHQSIESQTQSLSQQQKEDSDISSIGINLSDRLFTAAQTREFNGLQHMFVSAMGAMAYSQIDEEVVEEVDQRGIQYLSGDLLENVVEGPEGDAIYELYVPLDDEEDQQHRDQDQDQDPEVDPDVDVDVPMDVDHDDDGEDDHEEEISHIDKGRGKGKERGRSGSEDVTEIIEIVDDDDDD